MHTPKSGLIARSLEKLTQFNEPLLFAPFFSETFVVRLNFFGMAGSGPFLSVAPGSPASARSLPSMRTVLGYNMQLTDEKANCVFSAAALGEPGDGAPWPGDGYRATIDQVTVLTLRETFRWYAKRSLDIGALPLTRNTELKLFYSLRFDHGTCRLRTYCTPKTRIYIGFLWRIPQLIESIYQFISHAPLTHLVGRANAVKEWLDALRSNLSPDCVADMAALSDEMHWLNEAIAELQMCRKGTRMQRRFALQLRLDTAFARICRLLRITSTPNLPTV